MDAFGNGSAALKDFTVRYIGFRWHPTNHTVQPFVKGFINCELGLVIKIPSWSWGDTFIMRGQLLPNIRFWRLLQRSWLAEDGIRKLVYPGAISGPSPLLLPSGGDRHARKDETRAGRDRCRQIDNQIFQARPGVGGSLCQRLQWSLGL